MPRLSLLLISFFIVSVLGGCDGGLFGTGTGDSSELVDPVSATDSGQPGVAPIEPGASPDNSPESPSANTSESDRLPVNVNLSNTTPSGIDLSAATLPSLKLINLTAFAITVETVDGQNLSQTVSVAAQLTSELLGVNTGETTVSLIREDNDVVLASLDPLNAAADSVTTLVVETDASSADSSEPAGALITSLLALDTRVVASASGLAKLRIVSTSVADSSSVTRSFTLTPTSDDSSGAELVLTFANADNAAVGIYSLVNAGSYILSANDGSFSSQPIMLSADTVYTIIVTRNPQAPIYVEVDSLLRQ